MSKKEIADALNEIRFLASIRQKNIVGFLEAFLESNETELCIVMEYCGCGDLAQKVERYKRRRQYIDENVIWRYLIQCLKALQHLHEKSICHRDLKVANTFLGEDGSVKIGDMNVSKKLNKGQLQTQIGTPYYMSPEIWNNKSYDASSDIWSLGCMFYELCALRPPFVGDSFPSLKRAILAGRYQPIPKKYSDSLHKVIGMMLRLSSRERPTAESLLKSSELASKLQYDDCGQLFQQQESNIKEMKMKLMETIKVPQNLRKLCEALPKPCYPDVRPNSPTAWTCAEQGKQQAQQAKLRPAVPPPPTSVVSSLGPETNDENASVGSNGDPTRDSSASRVYAAKKEGKPFVEPPKIPAAEYYSRRPLAPLLPLQQQAQVPPIPQQPQQQQQQYVNPYQAYEPSYYKANPPVPQAYNRGAARVYAPVSVASSAVPPPLIAPKPAGYPARVQHYNRKW